MWARELWAVASEALFALRLHRSPPAMAPKRSASKGVQKKKKRLGKNPDAWTSDADKNCDGKVSRSEAKQAGISVSAKDLNEDGRVLRSETRRVARTKLK